MTRDPWLKFYPSDWRSDPRLRMCSPAARGLWIDMLCLMHEADPYGHLLISGIAPTDAQLSMVTATPAEQLPDLIAELEAAGVFSRNRRGVIYSRRMTRDEKKRRTARENGRMGGNPTLGKNRGNSASDNPKDKPQKPEARYQKEGTYVPSKKPPKPPDRFAEFWAVYPRRKEPKEAEKRFRAAVKAGVDPQRIIDGAKRYAAERAGQDQKFTKHPTTWLNQGCWDDEPEPQPQRGPDERQGKRSAFSEAIADARRRDERRAAERDVADGPDRGDAFDLSAPGRGRGGHSDCPGDVGGLSLGLAAGSDRACDPAPSAIILPLVAGSWRN